MLTGRSRIPELMDDPNADQGQLERSLRFIRMVNRRLGGAAAALAPLQRWIGEDPVRIIDIGTGSADIPLAISRWAAGAGRRVHVTAVDASPAILEIARRHIGSRVDIELVQADALKLMDRFEPGSFDYAHAGMFLHHLDDIDVMTVLRIMDRLTTGGLIFNDLLRGPVERLFIRLLVLGQPAMVRHDAIVSVNAGFTRKEVLAMADRVGLANVRYRKHVFGRFTLVSEK